MEEYMEESLLQMAKLRTFYCWANLHILLLPLLLWYFMAFSPLTASMRNFSVRILSISLKFVIDFNWAASRPSKMRLGKLVNIMGINYSYDFVKCRAKRKHLSSVSWMVEEKIDFTLSKWISEKIHKYSTSMHTALRFHNSMFII